MIQRKNDLQKIEALLEQFPVVAILGARQCGKTTLAKQIPFDHYFDLENPRDLARLDQAQIALENLQGRIVIDEIQRKSELFPLLRYMVDQKLEQQYLILGSASRDLISQSSETLAGRIAYYHLSGFSLEDVGFQKMDQLMIRGGYPKSFLAVNDEQSYMWRIQYIFTFLERDIPQLGIQIPSTALRRFWTMLSHYHGQILNYSEIGRSFGASDVTVKKYIDILESTFMIRLLMPWFNNTSKRLVKSPKLYLRDCGIFHALQSIKTHAELYTHPKLGSSWEGFALEETVRSIEKEANEVYFWSTQGGAEVDLFWMQGGKNYAAEFKFMDAPRLSRSMHVALEDLSLEHLFVIYPGHQEYPLNPRVTVLPLENFDKKYRESSEGSA
ncbi:MAG TPA: ATP-binding protein [Caldisericia bacterium]|nr:ATP-binding protein [Caldisericia bacterium]HXK52067.1 ATP-binding protein [Caldisericia bacterium]